MRNIIGPPVVGSDFFGREDELALAWDLLDDGNHLLLAAPRRVGKTSFVRHLEKDAESRGWKSIYVDVEDKDSENGFIQTLVEKLKAQKSWFTRAKDQTIEKVEKLIDSIELELKADEIGSVTLKRSQSKIGANIKDNIITLLQTIDAGIIIVDELPVLLNRLTKEENGNQRVSDFLHWLRSLRQYPGNNIRWIFCGSVGLDSFAERLQLTKTINDLYSFPIGAFTDETANQFLTQIGYDNDFGLPTKIQEELLNRIGWPLPYYLQLVFNKLRTSCLLQRKQTPDLDDITTAFEHAAVHSNLGTWMERLDEQLLPVDAKLAKGLLDNLSKKSDGSKRNSLEQQLLKMNVASDTVKDKATYLLKMLERDGYLLSKDGQYAFRSPLLRIFWNNSRNL